MNNVGIREVPPALAQTHGGFLDQFPQALSRSAMLDFPTSPTQPGEKGLGWALLIFDGSHLALSLLLGSERPKVNHSNS